MGLFDNSDPDLSMNLGLGLLQAGGRNLAGQGNIGTALSGALQNYYGQKQAKQSLQMGNLDLQTKTLQNQKTMQLLNMVGGLMGPSGQDGSPQAGLMSAAPGASPPQQPPMGGQSAPLPTQPIPPQQSQQSPSWLSPPSQASLAQSPVGGMNPRQLQGYNLLSGKDPLQSSKELEAAQLEQAQRQYAPALAKLSTVIKSDSPTREVAADPELSSAWQTLAKLHGFDPKTDLNDQNLRTAFTFAHNGLASSIGQPTISPTVQKQQVQGPLGSMLEVDPVTNETKQVVAPQPLKDIIDPNTGKPTNVRASAAEGQQPFNASIFGASNISDQALQFAADTYRTTGKMPTAFGRNPQMQAKVLNKIASDNAQSGDTAGAIAARSQALKANGQALDQATKLESNTTSYYNTLDKNLTALQGLAGKVDSTGSPLINRVYRAWQQGATNDPTVAQYVTYMKAAEGEYAKIQSGSLGNAPSSDAARRDAHDVINKYMSQGGIDAVAQAMRGEGNNRLSSLRDQKQALMGEIGGNAPMQPGQAHPQDIQDLMKKYGH